MKKLKSEKGTEIIEFVILAPILLFVVFGSLAFILTIYAKIVVVDAAREGARAEALNSTTASEKVKEVLRGYNLKEGLIESVTVETKDENGTQYVYVQVVYKQPSLFPGLPKLIGNSQWPDYFMLSSRAVFKKERLTEAEQIN